MAVTKEKEKPISANEKWLADYAQKPWAQVRSDTGHIYGKEEADEFLRNLVEQQKQEDKEEKKSAKEIKVDTSQADKLQKRAESLNAADEKRLQRENARKAEEEQEEAKEKEQKGKDRLSQFGSNVRQVVGTYTTNISENIGGLADKIGSVRTVGGIGLMLAILVFLLLAVVQVNNQGDTRLKLLWYMLSGQTTLQGAQYPTAATPQTTPIILGTGVPATAPTTSAPPGGTGTGPSGLPTNISQFLPSSNSSYRPFTGA